MRTISTALLLTLALSIQAQSFRETFTEANILTDDGIYGLAIPFWEALLSENQDNANLNYKLGRCYLSMGIDREQALPYLIKASKDVAKIYDHFSSSEASAPIEVYHYLAKAFHISGKLDDAELNYQRFLDEAGRNHILRPEAEKGLEMCQVARELMASPVDVTITNIGTPINSECA